MEQVGDILQLSLLLDFYGELLTPKQRDVFTMYHQDDLSLSEIAAEEGVSRQAVQDQLRRTEKLLAGYEERLGLVARFLEQKRLVRQIRTLAGELNETALGREIIALADRILE